jgi:flavin-dependent dehydrogenase
MMNKAYDAIVVGARCAGSTVATYLAKAGYSVLLVDRTFFPSDVISTHTIFNNTVKVLREIGVLDKLLLTDTPALDYARIQHDDVVIEGKFPAYEGEQTGYCFRRTYFDKALLDHAREQENVTALEGFRVTEVIKEAGVVVGVKGRDRQEQTMEFRAKLVIGADGRTSTVRREVGAARKACTSTEYATFYGYFEDVKNFDRTQFEIYTHGENRAYIFPTSDGHHVVVANCAFQDTAWMRRFKSEPEKTMHDFYGEYFPRFAERIEDARPIESMKGLINFDNYWYTAMGAGWALLGDAVCFKDPGLGQGIHDAIYGAKILISVLQQHDNWGKAWNEMAQTYQNELEQEFMARFEVACRLTKVSAHTEEELDMYRHIAADDVARDKYLGFYNYTADHNDLTLALTREQREDHQAVS